MIYFLSILAICANPAPTTAEAIISASESATVDYKGWRIGFDKADLQAVAPLIGKAKPDRPGLAVFTVESFDGVLRTREGDYSLTLGEDKRGGRFSDKALILLRPLRNGVPDFDHKLRFLLEDDAAVQFLRLFYEELKNRANERDATKITK